MNDSIKQSPEQKFTAWVTVHLSPNLIFSAFHLANLSLEIEKLGAKSSTTILQHRSFVSSSIISSVAFLESVINEFFSTPQEVDSELRARLSAIWAIENFTRTARTLEKYQAALKLAEKNQFEKGTNPYQDAKNVIGLRNALIHFVPEIKPTHGKPGVEIPLDDLGERLRGKFKENPLLQVFSARFGVIRADGTMDGEKEKVFKNPFFPETCLSGDCARWAAQSVLNLADEFFARLALQSRYEYLREHLFITE